MSDDISPPPSVLWAQVLNWRHAPRELTLEEREQCVRHGLPGGKYGDHAERRMALRAAGTGLLGGPLQPGSVWDVAPATNRISQEYGCVTYQGEWICPGCGEDPDGTILRFHAGIDLGHTNGGWTIYRTPVVATRPGVVAAVGIPYLGEQAVAIHADEGVYIEHGHMDEAWVGAGMRVAPGDVIGLVGTRGASSAPHMHLEVRVDGPWQGVDGCPQDDPTRDPTPWLNGIEGEEDMTPDQAAKLDGIYAQVGPEFAALAPTGIVQTLLAGKSEWQQRTDKRLDQQDERLAELAAPTVDPAAVEAALKVLLPELAKAVADELAGRLKE